MATWIGASPNYNDSTNWTGGDTPDAPGETALFDTTGSTNVMVNAAVNPDSWTFSAAAQSYFIAGATVTLNSGLVNNASADERVFANIVGPGSLVQNGSGRLTLEGDNTYAGGTTINAGTLRVGNGLVTGSIVGDVLDNGTLMFSRSNALIYGGIISGAGGVLISNGPSAGFTILTGDNSYTGGTTISSGTLVIGNKGTTGSIVGNIVDNSQLTFNRADSTTFAGLISGNGGMTKFGAGTLTLTANNTYSNGTVIAEGTLQLGNGGTTGSIGSSTLNDGGMLVFDRSNSFTFNATIFGTGAVTQLGTGMTVLTQNNTYDGDTFLKAGTLDLAAAGAAGHGSIVFGAGSQSLRIEASAFSGSQFGNVINSFGVGDVIDLRGLAFASDATANYDASSHALTVTSGGVSKTLVIDSPEFPGFKVTDDGVGGTQVTLASNVHWLASSDLGAHPAGWVPSSTRDFNQDGTTDVLWFNSTNLDIDLWKLADGKWAGSVDIGSHPAGYRPAGVGDFNHDGTTDLLWYNPTTGDVDIWKLANGQWAGSATVGPHPLNAQPVGSADFTGDGIADVLWFNPSSNGAELWKIQDGHWAGSIDIGTHPAGWQPFGSSDIDGDGTTDLFWYNPTTRDFDIWKIVDGHWAGSVDVGAHPAGYAPAGIGDFNGDGSPDIAWFNPATGQVDIWLLQDGHWAKSVDLGSHPVGWSPAGIGDFNGDTHRDMLWYNPATNHAEAWLLSNT